MTYPIMYGVFVPQIYPWQQMKTHRRADRSPGFRQPVDRRPFRQPVQRHSRLV